MTKKHTSFKQLFTRSLAMSLGTTALFYHQAQLKSIAVRLLSQAISNPAKERGIWVDLGPGIPHWNKIMLVGHMSKPLSQLIGHPIEAVAYSRFGGFNLDRRFSDFQNPNSQYYQCWYGAYIVFDNEHRQQFGFNPDGTASVTDALHALEADQMLVDQSTGIPFSFDDGHLVKASSKFNTETIKEDNQTWQRLSGQAQTWSTYHRKKLPTETWHADWCYGSIPSNSSHGVDDMHRVTYRGEFWSRYDERWQASCCKFFIYPTYPNRYGRDIDKVTSWFIKAGQAALAGIKFGQK